MLGYATVDVTATLTPQSVLAVEAMAPLFAGPCDLHACHDTKTCSEFVKGSFFPVQPGQALPGDGPASVGVLTDRADPWGARRLAGP